MKKMNVEQIIKEMTPEEKAQMCSGRDFWHTQDNERLGIPKVMMCDGPNGLRKQIGEGDALGINESIKTVCFPTAAAMASSFDTDLLRELGETLGDECRAEKVGMLLGPGINIKRSPLCGRNFEYFSEDPYLAGKLAASYIKGLQSRGVASCVKHFACNNQETARMSGNSKVDERTLFEIYLPAFEMAVKEGGTRGIMNAYNRVNDVFCAENHRLLTEILRKQWEYKGFVVTDWGAVKDRVKGLQAGVDLEMPGSTEGKTEKILKALHEGTLSMNVLDDAVRNILCFVNDAIGAGLISTGQKDSVLRAIGRAFGEEVPQPQVDAFDRSAEDERSCRFEEQCAVLMKNQDGVLPLKKERKIAVIGNYAKHPRCQGAGSSHINVPGTISFMDCAGEMKDWQFTYAEGFSPENIDTAPESEEALLRKAVQAAEKSDTAVIFAGLPEKYESEGFDREHMQMPEEQNRLIESVAAVQPDTVVVLHCGAPVELPWIHSVKAVLCMYLGGDRVGQAEADLLTGRVNPSGKLAETWPVKLEDNPSFLNFPGEKGTVEYKEDIFVGYRYYDKKKSAVAFPFGHGLSYTDFTYSDLHISADRITEADDLTVTCKVKNSGTAAGSEAAQLYVGYSHSAVRRAVRELKGFRKIELQPGEEKNVAFCLDQRAFAYYETKISDWFVESGPVEISIGSSSRDIRLSGNVYMNSSMTIPVVFSRYSTIGDMLTVPKGKSVFQQMFAAGPGDKSEEADRVDSAMGGDSEKARTRMMLEMPLNSLVSYGRMTDAQLDQLLQLLNS